jgi:hypothetical protein
MDKDALGNFWCHEPQYLHDLPFEGCPTSRVHPPSPTDAGWPCMATHPGRVRVTRQISMVWSPDWAGLGGQNPHVGWLRYWTPSVASEPLGESKGWLEVGSSIASWFFGEALSNQWFWAFPQCHHRAWCWCHGFYPYLDRPKFCGGVLIALEPSTESKNWVDAISHCIYSFEPQVELVRVVFLWLRIMPHPQILHDLEVLG